MSVIENSNLRFFAAHFRRKRGAFRILIARLSNDNDVSLTLRWWCVENLLMPRVSCEKLFLSTKKRNVPVLGYAQIDCTWYFGASLYMFKHSRILRLVKVGHPKRDREYWDDYASIAESGTLFWTSRKMISDSNGPNFQHIFLSTENLFPKFFDSADNTKTIRYHFRSSP